MTETDLGPPSGFIDWSPRYLVEPRGLSFAKVAALQVPWISNTTSVPSALAIYARDENGSCTFKPLVDSSPTSSIANYGFEQASLLGFGYLFVGVPSTVNPATCGADASAGN